MHCIALFHGDFCSHYYPRSRILYCESGGLLSGIGLYVHWNLICPQIKKFILCAGMSETCMIMFRSTYLI